MKKLMKYEIKGTYKFILGILLVMLLASTIIQLTIANSITNHGVTGFPIFMIILSIFVIFGAYITVFFYIVNSFRRELYDNRGYLTFTLPLTGKQVLGSKLLIAVMWNVVIAVFTVTYNAILYLIAFRSQFELLFQEFFRMMDIRLIPAFFSSTIYSLLLGALTLLVVYFAIALSKVSIKNKKIGGMWFIIFLILMGVISYTSNLIGLAFPYFLDLDTIQVITKGSTNIVYEDTGHINIASFIIELGYAVLFFFGTAYLLEKKVDL